MHPRAAELIARLDLVPHPEGGHYRRIFQSTSRVQPLDGRDTRAAITTIHFLLSGEEISRWHRVASDEAWHLHEGDGLELFMADPRLTEVRRHVLGPAGGDAQPVLVVPAGSWQAARAKGPYALMGCTVGPGFDFADFEMLRDEPDATAALTARHPAFVSFV